jgi:glycosyltransferase involved in cell wall biosynthesis
MATIPGSIAVIIPTYDHGALLREAVESVLAQTRPATEIIVVSDGAPIDPTPFVADLPHEGRLRILVKPNGGAPAARDFGARHATSEYFLFFDDDDILLPDALEQLGDRLDARPDAVAAAGATRMISRPGEPVWFPNPAPNDDHFDLLLDGSEYQGGATLIRATAFWKAGGYASNLFGIDDWFLNLRLARYGPFAVYFAPVINYREHAGSFSAKLRQLELAPSFARQISQLVGRGGHAAGNRLRIVMIKRYLPKVLDRLTGDLRAHRWGAAAQAVRSALWPLLFPWPSRSVLLTWIDMYSRRRRRVKQTDSVATQEEG